MPIQLGRLQEKDKGRWVSYSPRVGQSEDGRLKGWNDKWVFVVYRMAAKAPNWTEFTAAASNPDDLDWIWPIEPDYDDSGSFNNERS